MQIGRLKAEGVRVSLFVDADEDDLLAASAIGADIVELHTGQFCALPAGSARQNEYNRIVSATRFAHDLGWRCMQVMDFFETVGQMAQIQKLSN